MTAPGTPPAARGAGDLPTERLLLRRWRAGDSEPFAAINADREVMEHFPQPLSAAQSDALIARIEASFERRGYGLWALELRDSGVLAGFVGLEPVESPLPFAPAVEIGWRLAREQWGRGYASEAAAVVCTHAFGALALPELVSYTAVGNTRSRRVMERIGMRRDPAEDFEHPKLAPGHPLRAHVLYRLAAPAPGALSRHPSQRAPRAL